MDRKQIIYRDIAELTPYENNPRDNDKAVDAVAASIKEFHFQNPIIVDKDGVIVAGHTRLKAAIKLGLKKVPVIVADDLTEEQVKAFRLADNKTGELAEWDFEKLEEELRALDDIDMGQFGFEDLEEKIHDYDVKEDDFDEDEVPKEEPKAKRGDIYQLGDHRLMCGDSTNPDDLKKLLGGGESRPGLHGSTLRGRDRRQEQDAQRGHRCRRDHREHRRRHALAGCAL